jgi:hypothetical protein
VVWKTFAQSPLVCRDCYLLSLAVLGEAPVAIAIPVAVTPSVVLEHDSVLALRQAITFAKHMVQADARALATPAQYSIFQPEVPVEDDATNKWTTIDDYHIGIQQVWVLCLNLGLCCVSGGSCLSC